MSPVKPAPPQRSKAGHALAARMRELGLNQAVIANAMYPKKSQAWVSQSLFDDAESAIIQMVAKTPDNFERLLRVLQWPEVELFKATGLVPPVVRQEQAAKLNAEHQTSLSATERGYIRVLMNFANGGKPVDSPDYQVIPESLYRPGCRFFQIMGNSMAPEIPDGDAVLVDPNLTDLVSGKLYVVRLPNGAYTCKRARLVGGEWWLFSDNREIEEEFQVEESMVVGRVYRHLPSSRSV
jgi:phage repressor protein C with HTH and peptisase S24 domain